jgi:hydrogenase maturation protease
MRPSSVLIAGIGNVFLGDDGFGVEVAGRLAQKPLPAEIRVVDFGIRGIDLVYALLEPFDRVILIDALQRGGKPGELYVLEPSVESGLGLETHEMSPAKVLASAKAMGARTDHVVIVGCEPASFGSEDEPMMGLSEPVRLALDAAIALVESLATEGIGVAHA